MNEKKSFLNIKNCPIQKSNYQYPVVIFFDGKDYLEISTPTILDNLISSNTIHPMICVFIGNVSVKSRENELMCNHKFNQFLKEEFIAWLYTQYRVSKNPCDILIGGASAGGNAGVFAAYNHPEVFGNVFSQSGGFWWIETEGYLIENQDRNNEKDYGYLIRKFVEAEKLQLTFHMCVGIYDTATMEQQFTNHLISNRHMRDVLEVKGYNLKYLEYSGSHDWIGWRGIIPDILIHFNELLNNSEEKNNSN